MSPHGPGPEGPLNDLERRLAGWSPSAPRLDRDRMLFEAGRAAARAESAVRWRVASALAVLLVAANVAAMVRIVGRPGAVRDVIVTKAPEPASEPIRPLPIAEPDPSSYLRLTQQWRSGPSDAQPAPPPTVRTPSNPEPPLSPLSARRPGGLVDL